jgi:hypothetical protein
LSATRRDADSPAERTATSRSSILRTTAAWSVETFLATSKMADSRAADSSRISASMAEAVSPFAISIASLQSVALRRVASSTLSRSAAASCAFSESPAATDSSMSAAAWGGAALPPAGPLAAAGGVRRLPRPLDGPPARRPGGKTGHWPVGRLLLTDCRHAGARSGAVRRCGCAQRAAGWHVGL